MKKILLILVSTIGLASTYAQSPDAFNYQAVLRDASGALKANTEVIMGISILKGGTDGTVVYSETHTETTNNLGLVNLEIGNGTVEDGDMTTIDWSAGPYYIKISVDGTELGTSQLLSVPYALHANTTSLPWTSVPGGISYTSGKVNVSHLAFDSTGSSVFIGSAAGENDDLTGNENVFIGSSAGYSNTGGIRNTATGYKALYSNIIGMDNTANGNQALYSNTTGVHNTATGYMALNLNTSGQNNAVFGYMALFPNKSGNGNTAIGYKALYYDTTGGFNTAVGYNAGPSSLYLNLNNTGAFGCGSQVTASNTIRIGNSSITQIGGQVAWSNLSDGRFKRNVKANVPGLDFILKLRPVTFNWDIHKLDEFTGIMDSAYLNDPLMQKARSEKEAKIYTGFIAQDVEEVANECGFDFSGIIKPANEKTPYNLSYAEFVVPLVKAVQELSKQNEEMKKEIELLKAKLNNTP